MSKHTNKEIIDAWFRVRAKLGKDDLNEIDILGNFLNEAIATRTDGNSKRIEYIELSDGRVGFVDDINNERFQEDLKRLNLTYNITTENHYTEYMMLHTLSPEQVYYYMGGKQNVGY